MIYKVVAFIFGQDNISVPKNDLSGSTLQNVINIVLAIAASVALLLITIAGFKYVMSQGNPDEVAQAKNQIIYALVGLVITMAAFGITTFIYARIQ